MCDDLDIHSTHLNKNAGPIALQRPRGPKDNSCGFICQLLSGTMSHTYEIVANFLKANTTYRPEVGIICGSGLSGLSKSLENSVTFKYEDIPGFPSATVPGHAGELVFGTIGGIQTVCMRGRFHYYEGNSMEQVVLPVRVMRLLGVKLLVVTNAAGGLNPAFNVGDIVVIQDHFGLVSF